MPDPRHNEEDYRRDDRCQDNTHDKTSDGGGSPCGLLASTTSAKGGDAPKEQAEDARKDCVNFVAYQRKDDGTGDISLPGNAAEEVGGSEKDTASRSNKTSHRVGKVELHPGTATRYPRRSPARPPRRRARPPAIARSRVEVHVNLLSYRTSDNL